MDQSWNRFRPFQQSFGFDRTNTFHREPFPEPFLRHHHDQPMIPFRSSIPGSSSSSPYFPDSSYLTDRAAPLLPDSSSALPGSFLGQRRSLDDQEFGIERVQKRIRVENEGQELPIRSEFFRSNESVGARLTGDEWRLSLIREHGGQIGPIGVRDYPKEQQLQYSQIVKDANFGDRLNVDNAVRSEHSYRDSSFQISGVERRHFYDPEENAHFEKERRMGSAWLGNADSFHNSRFGFTGLNGPVMPREQVEGARGTSLSQDRLDQSGLYGKYGSSTAQNLLNIDRLVMEKNEREGGVSLSSEYKLGSEHNRTQINSQVPYDLFHRDTCKVGSEYDFRKEEHLLDLKNDWQKDPHCYPNGIVSNPSRIYGYGQSENSIEIHGKNTFSEQQPLETYKRDNARTTPPQLAWSPPSYGHSDTAYPRNNQFLSESLNSRHQNLGNHVWQNHQEDRDDLHTINHGEQTLSILQQGSLKQEQGTPHDPQHPKPYMHTQNWQVPPLTDTTHQRGHHRQQYEQRNYNSLMDNRWHNSQPPELYARQDLMENMHGIPTRQNVKSSDFQASLNTDTQRLLSKDLQHVDINSGLQLVADGNLDRRQDMLQPPRFSVPMPMETQNMSTTVRHSAAQYLNKQGYMRMENRSSQPSMMQGQVQDSEPSGFQPSFPQQQQPLPMESPPPPPPPPGPPPPPPSSHFQAPPSPPTHASSPKCTLAPAPVDSSTSFSLSHPPAVPPFPEVQYPAQAFFHNKPGIHSSVGFSKELSQSIQETPCKQYAEEGQHQPFQLKQCSPDKPKVVDAVHLFKQPHRATRPDHIVIILRGLPGSGKSYLAKKLRDLEVANGGNAPRIHSMDDYFMTEVEKVEDIEGSISSSSVKGKKRVTKMVMEYCYEPEMEEAYRASMLKAFKKTLDEGNFTFIIVDDRNLRVADFAQFWAIAKRSGYEVYLLEAAYKDPSGCAARNVHGFASEDIQRMADKWEQAPPLYLQLNTQSLFHGDHLNQQAIREVEMDTDDVACNGEGQETKMLNVAEQPPTDHTADDSSELEERCETEKPDFEEVKELGKSKWLEDVDEDEDSAMVAKVRHLNALSGLIQAYKGDKSVHWGDQVGKGGFSIGAAKRANVLSLIIGPGAGYNLDSNPLPEEENVDTSDKNSYMESRSRTEFLEHLRAEQDSFRAVFDRRRHRIGGLVMDDEN